jgi:hypothetical protein
VDDLIYPNGDGTAGVVSAPSLLDVYGLLFGPAGGARSGSQHEINIFGNGSNDYQFYT